MTTNTRDTIIEYRDNTGKHVRFARLIKPGEADPDWLQRVRTHYKPGMVFHDLGGDNLSHVVLGTEDHDDEFILRISFETAEKFISWQCRREQRAVIGIDSRRR